MPAQSSSRPSLLQTVGQTVGPTRAGFGGRRLVGRLLGGRPKPSAPSGVDGHADQPDDASRLTALVVDDSPIARMMIASILESFEVDVVEAGGSLEALAVVAIGRPDMVILDWTLREETAADVLDALAGALPDGLPPVIVVSASARLPVDLRAAVTLRKPFTPREFYGALTTALAREDGGAAQA